MAYQSGKLVAIGATRGFGLWHYGTIDGLSEVLAPGYFNEARGMLRAGHHLHVNANIQPNAAGDWVEVLDHALVAVIYCQPGVVNVAVMAQLRTNNLHVAVGADMDEGGGQ